MVQPLPNAVSDLENRNENTASTNLIALFPTLDVDRAMLVAGSAAAARTGAFADAFASARACASAGANAGPNLNELIVLSD